MNFPLALYNRQRPSRFLSAASPFIAVLLTLLIGCLIFASLCSHCGAGESWA